MSAPQDDVPEFEPMWDYVLLDPGVKLKSDGGILLPEGSKLDDVMTSLVVKAGQGAYRESGVFIKNPIKVGDYVYHMALIKPWKIKMGGKLYLCVSARDCIGIKGRVPQCAPEPEEVSYHFYDKQMAAEFYHMHKLEGGKPTS